MKKRVCSRLGIALIIVGSIFVLTTAAALAASGAQPVLWDEGDPTDPPDPTDPIEPTEPITPNMPARAIGLFFQVAPTDVVDLHDEGFGYGEICKAYFLSMQVAEADPEWTPEAILAMKSDDGMGWGKIVMTLSFSYTLDLRPGKGAWGNLGGIISNTVRTADRIAAKLGEEPEEIQELLEQGVSPGAIAMAYKLASQYDEDVTKVVGMRLDQHMGWGQIKRELGADGTATVSAAQGTPPNQGSHPGQGQDHGKKNGHGKGPDKGQGHGKGKQK